MGGTNKNRWRAALPTIAISTSLMLGAANADAATVSVTEAPSTKGSGVARVQLKAAPGESNQVTVIANSTMSTVETLKIRDEGAPITVGAGCVSTADVHAVTCQIQAPRAPQYESCGHDCVRPVPGTEWDGFLEFDLGDRDDSLEANFAPVLINPETQQMSNPLAVIAAGGTGDDRIVTGAGKDVVTPGPGEDSVKTNGGDDTIDAGDSPDGPDSYDGGGQESDLVTYANRALPIELHGDIAGAPGEHDQLAGVKWVRGGAGNDVLQSGSVYRLDGGPGDDRMTSEDHSSISGQTSIQFGGPGDDVMTGASGVDHIYGGEGDDTMYGEAGNDELFDSPRPHSATEPGFNDSPGGSDVAYGGEGNDWIDLGEAGDRGFGEAGNDLLEGKGGDDLLEGGDGNDSLVGGLGSDQLDAGAGEDWIDAQRTPRQRGEKPSPIDSGADSVECGSDPDRALINPWDSLANCEQTRVAPAIKIIGQHRIEHQDRWRLRVLVWTPGKATLSGRSVRTVSSRLLPRPGVTHKHEVISLALTPKPGALRALRARGSLRFKFRIRSVPDANGIPLDATRRVRLRDAR